MKLLVRNRLLTIVLMVVLFGIDMLGLSISINRIENYDGFIAGLVILITNYLVIVATYLIKEYEKKTNIAYILLSSIIPAIIIYIIICVICN